jgi:hypothetical protein
MAHSGTMGYGCYGSAVGQCTQCTTLIANKILSIGASTTALLSTLACQGEAAVRGADVMRRQKKALSVHH